MPKTEAATPLLLILRALENDARRDEFAALAGTSRMYLYQLAGCHNQSCRSRLAQAIEDASVKMAEKYGSPKITTRELATMCPLPATK